MGIINLLFVIIHEFLAILWWVGCMLIIVGIIFKWIAKFQKHYLWLLFINIGFAWLLSIAPYIFNGSKNELQNVGGLWSFPRYGFYDYSFFFIGILWLIISFAIWARIWTKNNPSLPPSSRTA